MIGYILDELGGLKEKNRDLVKKAPWGENCVRQDHQTLFDVFVPKGCFKYINQKEGIQMQKMIKFLGIAMVAIIGLSMTACPEGGGGGNTDPKTLVITMPASIYAQGVNGFQLGVFPVGTTPAQAYAQTSLVAGSTDINHESGTDPKTITVSLYLPEHGSGPWTGNGTYDLYAVLSGPNFYKKSSVNFSSATTSISISINDKFDFTP